MNVVRESIDNMSWRFDEKTEKRLKSIGIVKSTGRDTNQYSNIVLGMPYKKHEHVHVWLYAEAANQYMISMDFALYEDEVKDSKYFTTAIVKQKEWYRLIKEVLEKGFTTEYKEENE